MSLRFAAIAASLLFVACASDGPTRPVPASVAPAQVTVPPAPPLPSEGLVLPRLDGPWSPASISAGDSQALSRALGGHGAVGMLLAPRFSGTSWEKRVFDVVKTLSPRTKIVARRQGLLSSLMKEKGETPIERRIQPDGGRDLFGRPTYVLEDIPLKTDWLAKDRAFRGASAFLSLDDARLTPEELKRLREGAVGSCTEPLRALGEAERAAAPTFAPFLGYADELLYLHYRSELEAGLPQLRAELESFSAPRERVAFDSERAFEKYQCGHTLQRQLLHYTACLDGRASCPVSPRLVLDGGVRIGSTEPSVYLPDTCTAALGKDYLEALRGFAERATMRAAPHLPSGWLALADTYGSIGIVRAALEDVCTPQRRRYRDADLVAARTQLEAIGDGLRAPPPADSDGRFVLETGTIRSATSGALRQLARFVGGANATSTRVGTEARALSTLLREKATCQSGLTEQPVSLLLVDVGSSEIDFFGYFFEEELFCPELGVLTPVSAQ